MTDADLVWSRWDDVDRVFAQVLDLPASERRRAVSRLCGDDAELARAVGELLDLTEGEDGHALRPGAALLREVCGDPDPLRSADGALDMRVGRYRICGVLGRGGMATVYEARRSDGAYDQVVALKVLRRGLDTERIVRRFLAERQILSDFAHPNIARLLDGGATPDGRPFLVVEKVDGTPITAWADERRLDVESRLKLFLQVCDAVQEAHRRAVVHRDLKPSNILVDGSGTVKLLDFGIAKLLDSDDGSDLTELGSYPLTRRYASPEQVRGEPVTTSSDVYQLGLILYELLTGVQSFDPRGGDRSRDPAPTRPAAAFARLGRDAARGIAEARSATPATLPRVLSGDLDTVVLKALAHEPLERYRSADELARDVRLHLAHRPIQARPASRALRLRKWLRRNAWAPPVAAGAVLAVAGYVGTVTVTARRLEAERNAVREQAERAERIRGFLIDLFRSADPWEGPGAEAGARITVLEALDDAAERIGAELSGEPAMQADLLAGVASILGNLDHVEEGRPLVERAIALRREGGDTTSPSWASDLQILAHFTVRTNLDSAIALRERAVATLRAAVPPDDPRLADALAGLFGVRVRHGGLSDPALGEEALAIYRAADRSYRMDVASLLSTLAQAHANGGRLDQAETAATASFQGMLETVGPDHVRTAVSGAILAGVLNGRQRFDEAVAYYERSLPVMEGALGPAHNQTLTTRNNFAISLHALGRFEEAAAMHRRILEATRALHGEVHANVARSLQNLASVLKDGGRLREADSLAARAHRIYERVTPEGHYLRAYPLLTRTEILLLRGEHELAVEIARQALAILEPALSGDHFAYGVARCRLGAALAGMGRTDEGSEHLHAALEVLRGDERTPRPYLEECERAAAAVEVA